MSSTPQPQEGAREEHEPSRPKVTLRCRDCPLWYGEEDRGWGPCTIKHQRGDQHYLTFGGHLCDEGYDPAVGKAARFKGVRSTSRASAVGYSSTTKAGKRSVRATRRSSSGSSRRRRPSRSSS